MKTTGKSRIQFLDMARLVAVFMMIQGHTIKTLLAPEFQDTSNVVYGVWRYVRGFTAPMFMLIAGLVFTYLLFRQQPLSGRHPRYRKGLIRAGMLLLLGYWINCSGFFWEVWETHPIAFQRHLWRVDVLQSIGAGLLVLLAIHRLARPKFQRMLWAAIGLTVVLFGANLWIADAPLSGALPIWLSQYFTGGEGSLFPLVPWLAYLLIGAMLGAWLSSRPAAEFNTPRFALLLGAIGGGMVGIALLGEQMELAVWGKSYFWHGSPCLILFRAGWVTVVCALLVLIGRFTGEMPLFARQVSRNALWLYVGHLRLIGFLVALGWTDLSPGWAIATAGFVLLCMAGLTKVLVWLGNWTGIRL